LKRIETAWDDISPESIVIGFKSAVCQTLQMEQKMMSCGRNITNKTLLVVMKVLTVIGVYVASYCNKTPTLINTINIYHIHILTWVTVYSSMLSIQTMSDTET
jgi:hypothetical protein